MQGERMPKQASRRSPTHRRAAECTIRACSNRITETWSLGPIYCTPITAALLKLKLNVDERFIRRIELDEPQIVTIGRDASHPPLQPEASNRW